MGPSTVQQGMEEAMQLHRAGRWEEAEQRYRWVLSIQPDHSDAWHLLGLMAVQLNQPEPAIELASRAVAIHPGIAGYRDTLGRALAGVGRFDDAIAEFNQALSIDPNHVQAHLNLGNTLMSADRFAEALPHLKLAATALPDSALAQNNYGNCLCELGEVEHAIDIYRAAMKAASDEPTIHYNLATSLLMTGAFEEGFTEYQWRWKVPALGFMHPPFTQPALASLPALDPAHLAGKTILLHSEQGHGDTIQFIRYAPLLARLGARVLFSGPPPILRLVQSIQGIECVFEPDHVTSEFDLHCPLLDLPLAFKSSPATIPQDVPYLHPDSNNTDRFRDRIARDSINVGLIWAGRPEHLNDRQRSIRLDHLAALGQLPNVRLHSLQLGPASEEAKSPPQGMHLIDWSGELHDFADTAAVMSLLDVIVSVDTAPAHLAGALGKPLFLLLPFRPDWRWMLQRSDSPWYPTATLFRQPTRGDWTTPIHALTETLARWKRP